MKGKIIYGFILLWAVILFSSCPLVYPGGGSVTLVGTNELGTIYTLGDVKVSLTGDGTNESYSETSRFGAGGSTFISLPWVAPGNYSLRITVYDGSGNFLTDNTNGFWITEGEQKQVAFTVYDDGTSPRLSFGPITSGGGSSDFWVEQSGAGVINRWDFYQMDPVDPGNFQSFQQIGAWGNLQNLMKASVRYPDGNGVDFSPGSRNINVSVSYDYDGNFIGFNRPDYAEYGFYSWEFTSFSGEKVSGEVLLNPAWTSANVAKFSTTAPTMVMMQATIDWAIADTAGVDSLLGLVIHRDYRQIMGAAFFDPTVTTAGGIPAYDTVNGYPTMSYYDIVLLTLDAPVTQEQLNSLWDVSADDVATQLLFLDGGPHQVGVHAMEFYY